MTDPKLVVVDARQRYAGYSICWFFPDEGEEGGYLGDDKYTERDLAKASNREERDHILATITASKTDGAELTRDGLVWESRTAATNALRAIKAALQNSTAPWPEWAVKAKAEGWTPPKGWKP